MSRFDSPGASAVSPPSGAPGDSNWKRWKVGPSSVRRLFSRRTDQRPTSWCSTWCCYSR